MEVVGLVVGAWVGLVVGVGVGVGVDVGAGVIVEVVAVVGIGVAEVVGLVVSAWVESVVGVSVVVCVVMVSWGFANHAWPWSLAPYVELQTCIHGIIPVGVTICPAE